MYKNVTANVVRLLILSRLAQIYVKTHRYLVIPYFVSVHGEGYDELVSAQGQAQEVPVGAVIYQSYVCSNPASENVSDLHVTVFCCHDV